jgi:hypothetical protein
MFPSFLSKSGDKLLYNGSGELIYYDVFDSNGKHRGLRNFAFPTMIRCKPNSMEKVREFAITKDIKMDYRLLKFKKGDEAICNVNIPKSIDNTNKFVNLLIGGNLPPTIPYKNIYEYIIFNASINGFSYNINAQMLGIITAELCRDKNDLTKPFRLTDMKDPLGYTMVSIKMLPKFVSPYVAITSENADESIASALVNKAGSDSPLEKVMMN